MKAARFYCLWLVVLLNPGLLFGQLEMKVEMPKKELILGEPAYIKLTIKNIGQNPQRVFALWAWNTNWLIGGYEFPCILEKFDNGVWKQVKPSTWSRDCEGIYTSIHYKKKAYLEPGESFEVWWDIKWRYDLVEGRYRVSIRMKLGEELGQGQELTCEPIDFEVKVPKGKDLEVWEKRFDYLREMWYRLGRKDIKKDIEEYERYDQIYSWLEFHDAKRFDNTTYLPWSIYFRLQDIIYFNGSLHWINPDLLEKSIKEHPDFPLIHRLEIVAKFLKLFPMHDRRVSYKEEDQILQQYPLFSEEWWNRVRQLMVELIDWKDFEWVERMVLFIANNTYYLCLDTETQKKLNWKSPYYFLEKILGIQRDKGGSIIWWELPKEKRPTRENILNYLHKDY